MRARISLLAVLCLFASACGGDGGEAGPGIDPAEGFTQGDRGEPMSLSYGYQPDTRLEYDFAMDMEMSAGMDFPGMDDFDEMEMAMGVSGTVGYEVAPGPTAGTVAVTFDVTVDDISMGDMTIGGMPSFDAGDLGDLGEITDVLPELTVVIDDSGEVLEVRYGDTALPTDLFAGGLQDPSGVTAHGMLLGPELPDGEVRIGAQWVTDHSQDVPFVGTVTSRSRHEIVSEEVVAGRSVVLVETVTETSDLELNLSDMMQAMATVDAAALGMTEAELAQLEFEMGMLEGMDMAMTMDYGDISQTTWLDPVGGLVVRSEGNVAMTMGIEFDSPEGSGSMDLDATVTMRTALTDDGSRA